MSDVFKYVITWANGTTEEYHVSDNPTVDHVANSRFGLTNAAAVLETLGHKIEALIEGVVDGQGQQQSASASSTEQGAGGAAADTSGAAAG